MQQLKKRLSGPSTGQLWTRFQASRRSRTTLSPATTGDWEDIEPHTFSLENNTPLRTALSHLQEYSHALLHNTLLEDEVRALREVISTDLAALSSSAGKRQLLFSAALHLDPGITFFVLAILRRRLRPEVLQLLIGPEPSRVAELYVALLHQAISAGDTCAANELEQYFESSGRNEDLFLLRYERCNETTDPIIRLQLMRALIAKMPSDDPFATVVTDHIALLDKQLQAVTSSEYAKPAVGAVGKSVYITVHSVLKNSDSPDVDALCERFQISDRTLFYARLQRSVAAADWASVGRLIAKLQQQPSLLSCDAAIDLLLRHNAPSRVCIQCLEVDPDPLNQFELAVSHNLIPICIEIATVLQDRNRLVAIRKFLVDHGDTLRDASQAKTLITVVDHILEKRDLPWVEREYPFHKIREAIKRKRLRRANSL
eukprot:TRINITY_DN54929_c0_g1_i1.p1 TRINITY_DN54929_c0_g1~~TRINITY_DN54929_c0_g1_i1.p1  ORF type:complete len:436 (+),score=60.05 TRINITY_DN54929_c0_g1_i1:24-1310(+)